MQHQIRDKPFKSGGNAINSATNNMTTDFYTIAEIENLQVIETTSAMNGYPQSLKKALIGFQSFEEAERIASEYGLSIEIFTKRDGWQLYYRPLPPET